MNEKRGKTFENISDAFLPSNWEEEREEERKMKINWKRM
jgi:hypothetical protein